MPAEGRCVRLRLILLYVLNEVTYDSFHENYADIYRIATMINAQGRHLEPVYSRW